MYIPSPRIRSKPSRIARHGNKQWWRWWVPLQCYAMANGVGRRVNEETKDAENENQKREKRKMERIRRQKQNKNENSCFIKTYVFFKTYICSWYVVRYIRWQRSTERSVWEEDKIIITEHINMNRKRICGSYVVHFFLQELFKKKMHNNNNKPVSYVFSHTFNFTYDVVHCTTSELAHSI